MWSYFGSLNDKIWKIMEILVSSQNLCKLLYYNTENPLSEPDIANTNILIMDKIFPLPKNMQSETERKSLINVYLHTARHYSKNPGFRKLLIHFDIISHLSLWKIDTGIRTYSLLHELDKLFNNQFVDDLSLKKVYSEDALITMYADYFYGYGIEYELGDNSNVSCG